MLQCLHPDPPLQPTNSRADTQMTHARRHVETVYLDKKTEGATKQRVGSTLLLPEIVVI